MTAKINVDKIEFQKLIEHSFLGIILLDAQFNIIYQSTSAQQISGRTSYANPQSLLSLIHPNDLPNVNALLQTIMPFSDATEISTFRFKHETGNYIWLQCSFNNMLEDPNVQAIVANFVDISEQKSTELELIKQTDQIAELLETMTDGFIALDENLCYTYVNGQALKMSRKTKDDLIGRNIWDVSPNTVGSATYQAIQTAFVDKMYVCNQDFYAPHQRWQENRVYPSGGGISLFIRDITKQKKEEHHLKLLESVVTNTTDSIVITEAKPVDGGSPRIVYVNEAFSRMTGYSAEEVIGKTPLFLHGPKTDETEIKRINKCLLNHQTCESTLVNYKKNGEEYWVNFSLNFVTDEHNLITHWIAIQRDVTERKNKELQRALLIEISQLFNQPMKFNLLLNKLLQKIVAYDHFLITEIWLSGADKNKLSLVAQKSQNPETAAFYKDTLQFISYNKGEGLPGAVWESGKILKWDYLENKHGFLRASAAIEAGIKVAYGVPIITENTTIGVLIVGLGEHRPESGKSLMRLFEKLSAHFGIEIRRKQLEEELNQIFDFAPDIITIIGTDGYIKKANPAMSTLLGFTETELLTQPLDSFLHPEEKLAISFRMEKFKAGEKALDFEARFITKCGKLLWLYWTVRLNPEDGLLFGVAKDVTDKKQTEQRLQASESNLNAVIESADAFIYSLDRDYKYVTFNHKLKKLMQDVYQVSIFPGYSILEFSQAHNPEDVEEWKKMYEKVWNGEVVKFEKEYTINGKHIYNSFSLQPIWQNNKVVGLSCFATDITGPKRTELHLKESERRYIELFQFSPIPKIVYETGTLKILDANKSAIEQYGYSRNELLKMTIQHLHPPEERPFSVDVLKEIKESKDTINRHAITHQKKNGEKINVDLQSNPIIYKNKKSRLVVVRDVTESLKHIRAIESQNKKLQEISWMQSHVVRAPLARIMGLIAVIEATNEPLAGETKKALQYLIASARELDDVIKDITLKTEVIDWKKQYENLGE